MRRPGRVGPVTHREFPRRLANWLDRHDTIIETILALRRRGDRATGALQALLAGRPVSTLRWSWQLWASLVEGDGDDPEALLLDVLPLETIERTRLAIWGPDWRAQHDPDQVFYGWSA